MYVTLVQFLSCLMRNEYEAAQILCKKGKINDRGNSNHFVIITDGC